MVSLQTERFVRRLQERGVMVGAKARVAGIERRGHLEGLFRQGWLMSGREL